MNPDEVSTEQPAAPESREGRIARNHKMAITGILEELIDAMESARMDGFIVEFSIQRDSEGHNFLAPDHPAIIKRW